MARRHLSRSGLAAISAAARIELLENRQLLAAPDLTAAIVSTDSILARGHSITVDYRITNIGDAATAQNWSDRIWLSPTADELAFLQSELVQQEPQGYLFTPRFDERR